MQEESSPSSTATSSKSCTMANLNAFALTENLTGWESKLALEQRADSDTYLT